MQVLQLRMWSACKRGLMNLSGPVEEAQAEDCGRSKTNGPLKSVKGAAVYLLCVTAGRLTSLI